MSHLLQKLVEHGRAITKQNAQVQEDLQKLLGATDVCEQAQSLGRTDGNANEVSQIQSDMRCWSTQLEFAVQDINAIALEIQVHLISVFLADLSSCSRSLLRHMIRLEIAKPHVKLRS